MNGRDAYIDFLQEQVDALFYATQLSMEARKMARLLEKSLDVVLNATMDSYSFKQHARASFDYMDEVRECLNKSGLSPYQTPPSSE